MSISSEVFGNKNDNLHKKFKISDDQTNIDKYRLVSNITDYHITSKLILTTNHYYKLLWFRESFEVKTISDLEYP